MTSGDYNDLNRKLTLFETGGACHEVLEPIGDEAVRRGYEVEYTDNLTSKAHIGIYSASPPTIPAVNSTLSFITFHGIDSAYGDNSWHNWSRFDVGLLPGDKAVEYWQSCSTHPAARPQIGAFCVGWPKSDPIFKSSFDETIRSYRQQYGIDGNTVLYAPKYECHGKIDEFVSQARPTADQLLIKHAPYDDGSFSVEGNLESHHERYANEKSVVFLDTEDHIFDALGAANIVVSDSKSVLLEAILTDTIPVTVVDWMNRKGKDRTNKVFPEFVVQTEINSLQETLCSISNNWRSHVDELRPFRSKHFANLGNSAATIVNLIEQVSTNKKSDLDPIKPLTSNRVKYTAALAGLAFEKTYLTSRGQLKKNISDQNKKRLEKYGVGKCVQWFDRFFRHYNR